VPRLFVALEPPAEVVEAAAAAARAARAAAGEAGRGIRWSSPGVNVHLTLAFLGEVPEEVAPAAAAALAEAAGALPGPLSLHLAAPGAFPSPRRARVLWLGVGGDLAGLAALHAALARALTARALPGGEARFSPHLTIGRSRSPRGAPGLEAALAAPVSPAPWLATEAVLFESELRSSGAVHRPLARHRLGSP